MAFDGYVVHMELFDCAGPGPGPQSSVGEGGGSESGAEGPEGTEGGGSAGGESGGEGGGTAQMLALDATFDETVSGARLVLNYDAASNSFQGTVHNATTATLTRVRIEVHLDTGVELGPTNPTDLAAGATLDIRLPSSGESFTGWTGHAEVGTGEVEGAPPPGQPAPPSGGGEGSGDGYFGGEHRPGGETSGGG